ncbi:MAG: PASTA domain-containing protein [Chitinophagales bacterium]
MKIIQLIKSRIFWINLGAIIVAGIITIFAVFWWLKAFTNHGESLTLNDLSGLTLEQTIEVLETKDLNYHIIDSNTYNPDLLPLSVIKQNPAPLQKVKTNRTIYLWLNASAPPMVEVPDLAGKQHYDMAIEKLTNQGFEIGELYYRPSDAEGAVLEVMIDSVKIDSGTFVPRGTVIDLVVGGGASNTRVSVPCVLGKTLAEAEMFIYSNELNIGYIEYDTLGLIDSSSALIYMQFPNCNQGNKLRIGEAMDIFLTQELSTSFLDSVNNILNNTLDTE